MTVAELQSGKFNWAAPWVGMLITVAIALISVVYLAGNQSSALETVREDVRAIKLVVPEVAAIKATEEARDREFDSINRRLDGIDAKLDRLIEGRAGPRR